jgi:hypothetical protein
VDSNEVGQPVPIHVGQLSERRRRASSLKLASPTFAKRNQLASPDRIHLDQQGNRAAFGAGLGIKHVRLAESEIERLRPRGVLAEQEAQVRGRLTCRRQR